MANPNKANGTSWETTATNYLNECGLGAKRTGSADMGSGDIHAREWTFEAKAEKVIDLPGYLKQLREETARSGRFGFKSAALIKNRRHSAGDGYAVMSMENYRALVVYVTALEGLMEQVTGALMEASDA
jgi:hypothetical protein